MGAPGGSDRVRLLREEGLATAVRGAYVGAAVTEIATLRAELSGPQLG